MNLEVKMKVISPKQVLSMIVHVKVSRLSQTIEESLSVLHDMVKKQSAESAGPPFGIYHGVINEEEDGPIEICLPVRGHINGNKNVALKQLYGGSAASVTLLGEQCEFPAILKGYDAAAEWIQANGYKKSGPPREVWHSGPGPDAKMEIIWLVR
jgi:effector-binding domain-containing protein